MLLQQGRWHKPKAMRGIRNLLGDNEEDEKERQASSKECYVSEQVSASSNKWQFCPKKCPLFAEHRGDGIHCDFRCVDHSIESCKAMNPLEPIPDLERGICRACLVGGCTTCAIDGTDTCAKCNGGYYLQDGICYNSYAWLYGIVAICLVSLIAVILSWVVSLMVRPVTNAVNLAAGLVHRSRSKLRMPRNGNDDDELESRPLWPLNTNLCTEDVAGPGILLEFNFQLALIIWALMVALGWYILSANVHDELLMLGLHRAENSRQNCIVVQFGYKMQKVLMPIKVRFVSGVYVVSFLLAMWFSVRQLRVFQKMDENMTTHKDFCARVEGLPMMNGSEKVEEELRSAVILATGLSVVGASVSWDFEEQADEMVQAVEGKLADREPDENAIDTGMASHRSDGAGGTGPEQPDDKFWLFSRVEQLFKSIEKQIERLLLGEKTTELLGREEEPVDGNVNIKSMLSDLKTCGKAFVIFDTEADRDRAVEQATLSGGIQFRDTKITLGQASFEPKSIMWQNCVDKPTMHRVRQGALGALSITMALAVWIFVFYAPYAYIMMSFNYAYGQEPGLEVNLAFTVVVVVGNALMYFTCSEIADRMGFEVVDSREVLYMLLYAFACMLNVLLDMVVTYYMAYWMMVGVGMRTVEGVPLAEVHRFTDRFETYAMQRSLGQNLMAYSFPCTFLVPFVMEPIGTIYLPLKLMSWIVGSHRAIGRWTAERCLTAFPMDLSRYADLLLNVMLAVLVFYFPGGFTHRMFLALAFSHSIIYFCDHYKVLRCIPSCHFASNDVDWWAQWMLSMPLGLVLASLVFKANCTEGMYCLDGIPMVAVCTCAFAAHVMVHTWALLKLVPRFGLVGATSSSKKVHYRECSEKYAVSFFNANPVHCLRSEYIYGHLPPCDFMIPGKEHLLRKNEAIGLYFQDHEAQAEDYGSTATLREFQDAVFQVMRGLSSRVSRSTSFQDEPGVDGQASRASAQSAPGADRGADVEVGQEAPVAAARSAGESWERSPKSGKRGKKAKGVAAIGGGSGS